MNSYAIILSPHFQVLKCNVISYILFHTSSWVFWLKIAKNRVYCCYRYCSKLFGKVRRETEFRWRCCRNCKKKYKVLGERENWISVMRLSKFLSYLHCPKWKPIVAMALPKMGGKKKIVATKLPKMEEKKNATSTIFFITNYKWLVIIGSNLNLTIRLLFCPNNNN